MLTLAALAGAAVAARADAPDLITYQGRLQESGSLVNGTRDMELRLCDAPTGGSCWGTGTTFTGGGAVTVVQGVFNVKFGANGLVAVTPATGPFPGLHVKGWWVQVLVGATALTPREQLTSHPYAQVASSVAPSGIQPGSLVLKSTTTLATNPVIQVNNNAMAELLRVQQDGKVGIGTALPGAQLDVVYTGGVPPATIRSYAASTNYSKLEHGLIEVRNDGGSVPFLDVDYTGTYGTILDIKDSGSSVFYIKNAGNVGVGLTLPTSRLHVKDASMPLRLEATSTANHPVMALFSPSVSAGSLAGIEFRSLDSASNDDVFSTIETEYVDKFSTSEDSDLVFKTRSAGTLGERLRIAGVNVGIGTTAPPVARLDVNGSVKLGGSGATFTRLMHGSCTPTPGSVITSGGGVGSLSCTATSVTASSIVMASVTGAACADGGVIEKVTPASGSVGVTIRNVSGTSISGSCVFTLSWIAIEP